MGRGYYWEFPAQPDTDPVLAASYADEAELAALRSTLLSRIAVAAVAPPVRFLLATGPGGAAFIMNAHHARLDGLACLRLFRAVAKKYCELGGGPAPAPVPVSASPGLTSGFRAARRRRNRSQPLRLALAGSPGSSPSPSKVRRSARAGYGVS